MLATIRAHLQVFRISEESFFRAAYMWKCGKDMPPTALAEDVRDFIRVGDIKPYMIDYMLSIVSKRRDSSEQKPTLTS